MQKEEFEFMLSKISHEIRNPVTLINSFLQMMATKYPQVEQFDYWEDIQGNMEFLIDLLNELSKYNNAFRLSRETIDMNTYLKSVADSMRPTLTYLNITLHYEPVSSLPSMAVDKVKLREAILNLVRNASEAIPSEGVISIQAQEKEGQLLVTITDNGCGIPEEYLPTLFDPFVTHKKEGTGLGLPIAKQVVEAHGGSIHVTSKPGKGSSFQLSLPVNH